jgi:hypothetical protein
VTLVKTDVSEESSASIIRVTRISELRTALAVTSRKVISVSSVEVESKYENLTAICGPIV